MCIKKYVKNLRNPRAKKTKKSQPTKGKDSQRQQKTGEKISGFFTDFSDYFFRYALFWRINTTIPTGIVTTYNNTSEPSVIHGCISIK